MCGQWPARRPRAVARSITHRMHTSETLDDQPSDAVGGAVDAGVQIGADVLDRGIGCVDQLNPDAAVLVDPAAWPVLVPDTNRDPPDAVAVAGQYEAQPASQVLGLCHRYRESLSVDVDDHLVPLASPPMASRTI